MSRHGTGDSRSEWYTTGVADFRVKKIVNLNLKGIVKHIHFRLITESDADFVVDLRSHQEKSRHLSRGTSDVKAQVEWIRAYKQREQDRQEYYFVILDDLDNRLGVVRMYDFRDHSFCWGSWITIPGAPGHASIESALAIYEIAFYQLGFTGAHFDVRKENTRVVDFHKRFGARIVREDALNFYFIFTKDEYEKTRSRYRKFLA